MAIRIPRSAREQAETNRYAKPKTNLERAIEAAPNSFLGKVMSRVTECCANLMLDAPHDAKTNKGIVLAELFMWNWIKNYSEAMYKKRKKEAKDQNILDLPDDEDDALVPGNHIIGESRHFVATATVTEPVRRFSGEALAQWFWTTHKIPVIVTKEQIEKAKVPTKSQVKVAIVERT